jgi:hypothetical protein
MSHIFLTHVRKGQNVITHSHNHFYNLV